jgi:hypothetical protein
MSLGGEKLRIPRKWLQIGKSVNRKSIGCRVGVTNENTFSDRDTLSSISFTNLQKKTAKINVKTHQFKFGVEGHLIIRQKLQTSDSYSCGIQTLLRCRTFVQPGGKAYAVCGISHMGSPTQFILHA